MNGLGKLILDLWPFAGVLLAAISLVGLALALYYLRQYQASRNRHFQTIRTINNLEEGVYRSSLEGKQLEANDALVRLNGYETEKELLDAVRDIASEWYVDPNRRAEFRRQLEEQGKITNFVSQIYRHKTREKIWITENAWVVADPDNGKPLYYEGTVRDITDKVAREQSEMLLKKLAEHVPGGLFQFCRTPEGEFQTSYLTPQFIGLCGLEPGASMDTDDYLSRIHPDDLEAYHAALKESGQNGTHWSHEFRHRGAGNEYRWLEVSASPEHHSDGTIVWHGYLQDITERKHTHKQMELLAFSDSVTRLPNRERFLRELDIISKADTGGEEHCAICFLDLDNFKLLNDSHGHDFGDKLLNAVAERLGNSVRDTDMVARFGGDEFVILFRGLTPDMEAARREIEKAARNLMNRMRQEFSINNVTCPVTFSMGIVLVDDLSRHKAGDLLKGADAAMYEAKKSGRNKFVFFDISTHQTVVASYNLQRDLQAAISENQFALEMQPQIDNAGRIVAAEALVRWHHPERGLIMPGDFIQLAEETGQIGMINQWVLFETVAVLSDWQRQPGLCDLTISVNINAAQLLDEDFAPQLMNRIEAHGISSRSLIFELTEHAMAREADRIANAMQALRDQGFRFSLDDFGTGYSSLSQLNQFPFDELKIDGSFVAGMAEGKDVQSLVRAIIGMASALNMKTVAEHVSTDEQLHLLKTLGCDLYQGYLFSRPLSVSDFATLILAQHGQPVPAETGPAPQATSA